MYLCILWVENKWRWNKYQVKWLLNNKFIESITKLNYAKTYKRNKDWKIESTQRKVFLLRVNYTIKDELINAINKSIRKDDYEIIYFWKDFN